MWINGHLRFEKLHKVATIPNEVQLFVNQLTRFHVPSICWFGLVVWWTEVGFPFTLYKNQGFKSKPLEAYLNLGHMQLAVGAFWS